LEEVIVTAQRRTADVQKTSVSICVRTGQDLLNQGKYSLAQILEDVPGVEATGGGAAAQAGNGITIRATHVRHSLERQLLKLRSSHAETMVQTRVPNVLVSCNNAWNGFATSTRIDRGIR
jgi:hypothetical protein